MGKFPALPLFGQICLRFDAAGRAKHSGVPTQQKAPHILGFAAAAAAGLIAIFLREAGNLLEQ